VSELVGRLRSSDSKGQDNSGARLAVNGPHATDEPN
jgi:hypothetical protein